MRKLDKRDEIAGEFMEAVKEEEGDEWEEFYVLNGTLEREGLEPFDSQSEWYAAWSRYHRWIANALREILGVNVN